MAMDAETEETTRNIDRERVMRREIKIRLREKQTETKGKDQNDYNRRMYE